MTSGLISIVTSSGTVSSVSYAGKYARFRYSGSMVSQRPQTAHEVNARRETLVRGRVFCFKYARCSSCLTPFVLSSMAYACGRLVGRIRCSRLYGYLVGIVSQFMPPSNNASRLMYSLKAFLCIEGGDIVEIVRLIR